MAGSPIATFGIPTVVTDGATQVWDCTGSSHFTWTLGASRTMSTPTGIAPGQVITISVTQDATGSRLVTWPASFSWPTNGTAPTLTTTAAKTDIFQGFYDPTAAKWRMMTLGLNMA